MRCHLPVRVLCGVRLAYLRLCIRSVEGCFCQEIVLFTSEDFSVLLELSTVHLLEEDSSSGIMFHII